MKRMEPMEILPVFFMRSMPFMVEALSRSDNTTEASRRRAMFTPRTLARVTPPRYSGNVVSTWHILAV